MSMIYPHMLNLVVKNGIFCRYMSAQLRWLEHSTHKAEVGGSIPPVDTNETMLIFFVTILLVCGRSSTGQSTRLSRERLWVQVPSTAQQRKAPFRGLFLCGQWDLNGTFAPKDKAKVRGFKGEYFLYRSAIENVWMRKSPMCGAWNWSRITKYFISYLIKY